MEDFKVKGHGSKAVVVIESYHVVEAYLPVFLWTIICSFNSATFGAPCKFFFLRSTLLALTYGLENINSEYTDAIFSTRVCVCGCCWALRTALARSNDYVRKNAGQVEHFGDQERQVGYDDDDHRFHDAQVMRESRGPGAGETHQRSDADRPDDDDEERHDAENDVDRNDVLFADLTQSAEHVIEHLQQT